MIEPVQIISYFRLDNSMLKMFFLALVTGVSLGTSVFLILLPVLEKVGKIISQSGVYRFAVLLFKRKNKEDDLPLAVRRALNIKNRANELPGWGQAWLTQADKRINKSGVNIQVGRYLLGILLGAILGFIVGIVILNNLGAGLMLAAAAFLVPDAILVSYMQRRRTKIIEQLGAAVRVFTAEFNDTPQVTRALTHTAKRIPSPLGDVLTHTARQLAAGQSKDNVLGELMAELDFDYGRMFVQLLRLAWNDASVKPLFSRLATRIASMQSLIQKNSASMTYSRMMAMGVNALIIPIFVVIQWKVPGAGEFMTAHPVGRLLVTASFVSVLLGLIMDRFLNGVKV